MVYRSTINREKHVAINPTDGLFSDEDYNKIALCVGMPKEDVMTILSYNVITFSQMSAITNVSESQLRNASIPTLKRSGEATCRLDVCNPFPDEKKGKLFIHVNQKCVDYIRKVNNIT